MKDTSRDQVLCSMKAVEAFGKAIDILTNVLCLAMYVT